MVNSSSCLNIVLVIIKCTNNFHKLKGDVLYLYAVQLCLQPYGKALKHVLNPQFYFMNHCWDWQ